MSIEDVFRLLFIMRDDLESAAVKDVLLRGPGDLQAVLTLSTEFFTDQTTDYVLGGRFTAIGKVTNVLEGAETVNLTRRTALGVAAGPEMSREIVKAFQEDQPSSST